MQPRSREHATGCWFSPIWWRTFNFTFTTLLNFYFFIFALTANALCLPVLSKNMAVVGWTVLEGKPTSCHVKLLIFCLLYPTVNSWYSGKYFCFLLNVFNSIWYMNMNFISSVHLVSLLWLSNIVFGVGVQQMFQISTQTGSICPIYNCLWKVKNSRVTPSIKNYNSKSCDSVLWNFKLILNQLRF